MLLTKLVAGATIAIGMMATNAFAETAPVAAAKQAAAPVAQTQAAAAPGAASAQYVQIQPYRTFITFQSYVMDNNGDPKNPISNVRLEASFPGEKKFELPEGGQYWPIGNGQKQEINRTYELPWAVIGQADGFEFTVQMVRKGGKILPCKFKVTHLSVENRGYFCHTDVQWQMDKKLPEEQIDREGVQIRVFTDKNTPVKELPKDALALK